MMMVEINEETSRFEDKVVTFSLPLWKWKIIEHRAEALHQADMGACLSQIFDVGFMTEIKMLGAVKKNGPLSN